MAVEILKPLFVAAEPEHVNVAAAAFALGQACQHEGHPREPHKVPEVTRILKNLENGDPIIAATFSGYVEGWDAAKAGG